MTMLVGAPYSITAVSFDLHCATPLPPRTASSHPRSPAVQVPNSPQQKTASVQIPIASDARPHHISRGFLPWRFAYAGPSVSAAPPSWGRHPQTFTKTVLTPLKWDV